MAESYVAEQRYDDCLRLLELTPYFVNWEGGDRTWRLFNQSHVERGRQRLQKGDAKGAIADFDAALTYPANLDVGRSDKPEEAPAQYWRGKALASLGRHDKAHAAWQAGADVPGLQNDYRQKCRQALLGSKEIEPAGLGTLRSGLRPTVAPETPRCWRLRFHMEYGLLVPDTRRNPLTTGEAAAPG